MTSNLFTLTKFFNLFHTFISEVIDDKTNNEIANTKKLTPRQSHSISVNAVTFKYAGQAQPVLNGLTFNINAGEKVAIVGDNGSGKSTFVKLLLGFYTPTSGCIEVEGKDLSTLNLRSLRANIASVFQNFGQYHTSPFENIAIEEYAKASEADKQRIKALLALVELDIDVDAKLGKEFNGKDLSGGMWQKLAVARALHKSTKNQDTEPTGLLVLDEFSSALDPIIEKKLFSQLLAQAATIIVITHRLYNLNAFDSIIVFDNGRIIESGNFDTLIEKRGRFHQMWQAQNEH